jgi:hypothetical protein
MWSLTLLFIGLKLAKIIDWSWWLVLLPAYISIVIILIIVLVSAIFDSFN